MLSHYVGLLVLFLSLPSITCYNLIITEPFTVRDLDSNTIWYSSAPVAIKSDMTTLPEWNKGPAAGLVITWMNTPISAMAANLTAPIQQYIISMGLNPPNTSLTYITNITYFTNLDQVELITNSLARITHTHDQPYVTYVGYDWICHHVRLIMSTGNFTCYQLTSNNTLLPLMTIIPSIDSTHIIINETTLALRSANLHDLLVLAFSRHLAMQNTLSNIAFIVSADDTRRDNNRVAVGFLWFFVAVTMFLLICATSVWCAWIYPGPIEIVRQHAVFMWSSFYLFLTMLVSGLSGLVGFVALAIIYFTMIVICHIIYCCIRTRKREVTAHNVGHGVLVTEGDGAATGVNVVAVQIEPKHDTEMDDMRRDDDEDGNGEGAEHRDTKLTSRDSAPSITARTSTIASPTTISRALSHLNLRTGRCPDPLSIRQRRYFTGFAVSCLVAFVTCVAIFGIWQVDDYYIYQRSRNTLRPLDPFSSEGKPLVEYQPQTIAKGIAAVYSFDGYATRLKMNNIWFSVSVEWCGTQYSKPLSSDDEKKSAIYDDFIARYSIDMSLFARESYTQYHTVNDWFTRALKPGVRPVAGEGNPHIITCPADSRVMAFQEIPDDARVWIKGDDISVRELIGNEAYDPAFEGGSLMIARLAPQDYHRFHMPIDNATVIKQWRLGGTLHSVNADAMISRNYAIYNQRTVVLFNTTHMGKMAYVAIGATCVGSVTFLSTPKPFAKGDSVGYFEFGGSTVVLLFEKNRVQFEDDILLHSSRRVETLMQVNQKLGTVKG